MFDKERGHFELLIKSETNLKIWYKDNDQFDGLLNNYASIAHMTTDKLGTFDVHLCTTNPMTITCLHSNQYRETHSIKGGLVVILSYL